MRAAAKCRHLDARSTFLDLKNECGVQLAAAEVVILADEPRKLRGI
jgi:hypothetical protein